MAVYTQRITNTLHDRYQYANNNNLSNDSALLMALSGNNGVFAFLGFDQITIPKEANIVNATLTLYQRTRDSVGTLQVLEVFILEPQATPRTAVIQQNEKDSPTLPVTVNSEQGTSNLSVPMTADVTLLIQALVDHPNWTGASRAAILKFKGNAASSSRDWYFTDSSATDYVETRLTIEYEDLSNTFVGVNGQWVTAKSYVGRDGEWVPTIVNVYP